MDDFAARFDSDFSLCAFQVSYADQGCWYIDSEAPSHMTGVKEYFSQLKEGNLNLNVEIADAPSVLPWDKVQSPFRGNVEDP